MTDKLEALRRSLQLGGMHLAGLPVKLTKEFKESTQERYKDCVIIGWKYPFFMIAGYRGEARKTGESGIAHVKPRYLDVDESRLEGFVEEPTAHPCSCGRPIFIGADHCCVKCAQTGGETHTRGCNLMFSCMSQLRTDEPNTVTRAAMDDVAAGRLGDDTPEPATVVPTKQTRKGGEQPDARTELLLYVVDHPIDPELRLILRRAAGRLDLLDCELRRLRSLLIEAIKEGFDPKDTAGIAWRNRAQEALQADPMGLDHIRP